MLFYFSLVAFLSLLVMCKQLSLFKASKLIDWKKQWHTAIVLQSSPTFLTESSHYFRNWEVILHFQHSQIKWELDWHQMISISRRISTTETHGWAWTNVAHRKFWKSWDGNGSSMCYVSLCCITWNTHIFFSVALIKLDLSDRIVYSLAMALTHQVCFIGPRLIWIKLDHSNLQ
jgi:hypothetical protein